MRAFASSALVYIELPRDMVNVVPAVAHSFRRPAVEYDALALDEAVREAIERINQSKKPVIIAGVEIHRFVAPGSSP